MPQEKFNMSERAACSRNAGKRNKGLDCLKCLCAVLVVSIHKRFPGEAGVYISALARLAVPVFFMITGYFYERTVERKGEKRQIVKVLKLILLSNLFYCFWNAFLAWMGNGTTFGGYLAARIKPASMMAMVFFNESPFKGHLWYLFALLYVLLIVYFFDRVSRRGRAVLFLLVPVLLALNLYLGEYPTVLLGKTYRYITVRNFAGIGIPYFCIGDYIRRRETLGTSKRKSLPMLAFLFCAGCVLLYIERAMLLALGKEVLREHHFTTILLAVTAFLFFEELGKRQCRSKLFEAASWLGLHCSTGIYLLHPAVISAYKVWVKSLKPSHPGALPFYNKWGTCLVYLTTLLLVLFFYFVKEKGMQRKRK